MKAKEIYNKIEFWLVTILAAVFIFTLLIMSKDANDGSYSYWRFHEYSILFNFYKHFFIPYLAQIIIYYSAFVFLTKYASEIRDEWTQAGYVLGSFLIVATLISITNTYIDGWKFAKFDTRDEVYNSVFIDSFTTVAIIYILFITYYALREAIFYIMKDRKLSPNGRKRLLFIFLALACWISIFGILVSNHAHEVGAFWMVGVPYTALLIYLHARFLIPLSGEKKYKSRSYWLRIIPIIFLLNLVSAGIAYGIAGHGEFGAYLAVFLVLGFFFVIPLSWYIARNQVEKEVLQTALGSSQANLSFLRSQINPHFLFNALNTLYGTALQENADRTGEGIQKLGDMMRFMLHENMQEKISLAREIDYLNNYIDLQKLRTATSPNIMIQTNIEEQLNRLDISPMLLIPFVENAFKHGISLQQPSFINISLHTKDHILYFDVNNSVHLKRDYDPEKMKSGIGLQNVKQRLALLYPKKHELIIRESAKEFFIHLTIHL